MKTQTKRHGCLAAALLLACSGLAQAGSFYRWGWSEGPDGDYMDVDFYWSHSNADDFDKYEFCWRPINADRYGNNPCNYNSRIKPKPEVHFKAENEVIHHNKVYKYRIRARKKKNGNWTTLTSTISNPCFRTPVGGRQPLELSCGPGWP